MPICPVEFDCVLSVGASRTTLLINWSEDETSPVHVTNVSWPLELEEISLGIANPEVYNKLNPVIEELLLHISPKSRPYPGSLTNESAFCAWVLSAK